MNRDEFHARLHPAIRAKVLTDFDVDNPDTYRAVFGNRLDTFASDVAASFSKRQDSATSAESEIVHIPTRKRI